MFERTTEHPLVLELVDKLLHPGYLLTASQAICIHPGETPQPVHYDDSFYIIPRPRPAVSVSTIWALDDFTAANGGTEIIPGSNSYSAIPSIHHSWASSRRGIPQKRSLMTT